MTEPRIVRLVAEAVARIEGGGPEAIRDLLDEHPEEASLVIERIDVLRSVGMLSAGRPPSPPGRVVGNYRLIEEAARGAQAVVYRAEDLRLRRDVAVKLVAGSTSFSASSVARLMREAEALARLDHPAVCGVLDAGIEDEYAWVAMRWIRGESLAAWIARNAKAGRKLSRAQIRFLVEFFEHAARGLHAAHEAGIVHRDVKPSNLMIAEDGRPVVVDFGLASLRGDENVEVSISGQIPGTPAYMAPEQVRGDRAKIGRCTDVFALGVSLYEALTLRRPFLGLTRSRLEAAILEENPVHLRSLNRRIPAPLAAVVETAFEKDVRRRYQTAHDLAEDLRRVVASEPIAARPAGPFTRVIRWIRRRPAVAASWFLAFILIVIVPPVIIALLVMNRATLIESERSQRIETLRATREATRATRFKNSLIDVLRLADPASIVFTKPGVSAAMAADPAGSARVGVPRFISLLAEHVNNLGSEIDDDPLSRAELQTVLAEVCLSCGNSTLGLDLVRQAISTRQQELGPDSPEAASSRHVLASILAARADPEARNVFNEVIALRRRLLGDRHIDVARSVIGLAWFLDHVNAAIEIQPDLEQALGIAEKIAGGRNPETIHCLMILARIEWWRDNSPARARPRLDRAIALARDTWGPGHPFTAAVEERLGWLLLQSGQYDVAESHLTSALASLRTSFGNDCSGVASCLSDLGVLCRWRGDPQRSLAFHREALGIWERILTPGTPELRLQQDYLALTLIETGSFPEAREILKGQLPEAERTWGQGSCYEGDVVCWIARSFWLEGRLDEARLAYRHAFEIYSTGEPKEHPFFSVRPLRNLGLVLREQGHETLADSAFREAVAQIRILIRSLDSDRRLSEHMDARWRLLFGVVLVDAGQPIEGERVLRTALERVHSSGALAYWPWRAAQIEAEIGRSLLAQGRVQESEALLRSSFESLSSDRGPRQSLTVRCLQALVALLESTSRTDDAQRFRQMLPPGRLIPEIDLALNF